MLQPFLGQSKLLSVNSIHLFSGTQKGEKVHVLNYCLLFLLIERLNYILGPKYEKCSLWAKTFLNSLHSTTVAKTKEHCILNDIFARTF